MPTPLTGTHFVWCYIFPEIFRKLAFREGQDETSGNSIWSSLMRLLGYSSSFSCGKDERNDHSRLCDPKRKRCLSSNSADGDVAGLHRQQTFIIPVEALVAPEHVPMRVLEKICGKKLA